MADTRTVAVRLKADVTSYTTSMKQASQSTAAFDKAQAKSQRSAEKWRAVGMASQVGGAALAAGLLAATKAASNQEQAMGALTSVFKTNGAQMTANAKGATKMGLSTTDYANAAAKLGSQLSNLGVDQKDLGGATDDLIKKAGDLAAQFGGTTQEAVDALGAAMRGEADPAERYGLALNITAVNAEMAATGADKAGAMMALLNKQMEKSGAVGAMAREFDTAAASTQRAQAEFDNAAASLGEALLPAMAGAAKALSTLLGKFNDLPEPVKNATTLIVGLGAAALLAGPKVISAVRMMRGALAKLPDLTAIADPFSKSNVSMGKWATMATKVGAVGVAASIAIPLITEVGIALNGMTEGHAQGDLALLEQQLIAFARNGGGELGRFAGDAEGSMGSIGDAVTKSGNLMKSGFEMAGNQAQVARDQLNALDSSLASLAATSPEQAAAAFGKIQEATLAAGGSIEDLRGAFPQYVSSVDAAALSTDNAAASSNAAAEAKENEADALKKATEAYEAYIASVQEALSLLSAKDAMIGQEERLAEATKKNGTALKGQTKEAAANRAAIADEVSNITDLVQAKYDETGSLKAAENVRKKSIANLKEAAAAAGYNKDETNALLKKLDLLKPVNTTVTVDGVTEATAQVRELVRQLGRVAVQGSGLGQFGFGHAAGGYITGPGTGTSDSIPANLSNGEYVLRASAVKRIGVSELDRVNYATGGVVGYARGGKAKSSGGGSGLSNVDRWSQAVKDARDNLRDVKNEAADYAKTVADNILSGTGLFDMFSKSKAEDATKGLANAQDQLAEASRKVADAQVAVNTASPGDRAAAIKNLADAQRDLGDAQTKQADAQAAADAAAPTPANIMGRMKDRAAAIMAYASKVKTLMGKGLSMGLIKELAGSDMVEAGPVLDALLSMSPEALKQLGAVDRQAKDAAASVGDAVSGGAFGGKIGNAKAELGVSTDGLKDAIHDADKKYLDKRWRRTLNKAGLSAEERVQLMQSIKANDGKLTKHWRNVLAKAGLSAQESGDLATAIGGANLKLDGYSTKERLAMLRTLREAGFDAYVDGTGSILDGMTNKERKAILAAMRDGGFENVVANANTLLAGYSTAERRAILAAIKASDMDANVKAATDTADGYKGQRQATLQANKEANHDTEVDNAKTKTKEYVTTRQATMNAKKEDGHDTDVDNAKNKTKEYAVDRVSTLKAVGDTESAKRAAYDVALAGWKAMQGSGLNKFMKMPKPNPKAFGLAAGGLVRGAGTGTSDDIPAMLSNGEFVMRAAAVSKYGTDLMAAINAGRYANGGPVGYRTTTSAPMGAAGGVTTTSVPIIVQIDGRAIAQSQLKLSRQSGGTVTVGG